MKLKHSVKTRLALAFALGLLSVGAASAQNYSYFYQNSGSGALTAAGGAGAFTNLGTLAGNFDMEQFNESNNTITSGATAAGISSDTPAVGIQGFSAAVTLGTGYAQAHAVAGVSVETITSITFYLYASTLAPTGSVTDFFVYEGLIGRDGTLVPGTGVTLTQGVDDPKYVALTIPVSLFTSGGKFSIGTDKLTTHNPPELWNTVTQLGLAAETPGIAFNTTVTPIPETSSALLGALGSLILVRRKRA